MRSSLLFSKKKSQYAGIADRYSENIRHTFNANNYKRMLTEWMHLPKAPLSILDIGCGEGTITNFLKDEFANTGRVIGVDESEEMIAIADKYYHGIDFRVESMENTSIEDDSIDLVFSRFAVHYSEDLYKTLVEAHRVTKKGGVFFVQDVHPFFATFFKKSLDYEKKEKPLFNAQDDEKLKVMHPTFTFEEYINTFIKIGWDIQSVHEKYGRDAAGVKIAPLRVPTSVFFILKKR